MNKATEKTARKSRAQWMELMSAYDAGDLGQRAFCETNGVAYSTFGYWRKRLRTGSARASEEVAPLLDVSALIQDDAGATWQVELELPSGLKLRLR